jgi:aldose 1-epimerase
MVAACRSGDAAKDGGTQAGRPVGAGRASVARVAFGALPDSGGAIEQFILTNAHGVEVRAITYGAIITSVRTPDRTGKLGDIVFGYDSLSDYVKDDTYFGALVGRYANRIAHGKFTIDGHAFTLATNNGPNALHGGRRGFNKVVWNGEQFTHGDTVGVTLRYLSKDGEEGYPGNLHVAVTYSLTPADELLVDFEATSDKPTIVNLSQHSYWNLHGGGQGTILDHLLMLDASGYTPVDSTLIPTGKVTPVAGTPFDFRTPTTIGARIDAPDVQLQFGHGYDHNFVLDRKGAGLSHAARLTDTSSGRTLDIATTEPGIQFYSGNFLDGTVRGKSGRVYAHRGAVALETQHYPNSPNQPSFPSTVLRPGDTLRSRTVFSFGVMR